MFVRILLIFFSLILAVNCSRGDKLSVAKEKMLREIDTVSSLATPARKNQPLYFKEKNGDYRLSWKILREYNLENKKIGKNLKEVLDKNVNIIGFMIPLDYSAKNIKEFLLVPYVPSCAHVPPPPPNMIIKVKVEGKKGMKLTYYPIEVVGKIKLVPPTGKSTNYGAYSITASLVKEIKR